MFIECYQGTYSEFGYEPCSPCPQDTYQDSNGATSCIPCPYGGKICVRGANSSDQCRVYYGNFDIKHQNRILNESSTISLGLFTADKQTDRLRFNGTLVGWRVKLKGDGSTRLSIFEKDVIHEGIR